MPSQVSGKLSGIQEHGPVLFVTSATRFCDTPFGQHAVWIFGAADDEEDGWGDAAEDLAGDAEDLALLTLLADDGGHNPTTRVITPMDSRMFLNTRANGLHVETASIG